ncbi:hypothetical protein [Sphingosinicella sp. YJ22]|uniref:hypothetical protein n=1 Tax=Sphingosinicella sp. YJ22 TaxID=1104780 RepID=UPI00140CC45F|nr:hypothetical protein [Sphingosinicella sp. YJ22]
MAKRPVDLAQAMAKARAAPHSRAAVLSRLLRRRAHAHQVGDVETEARLREQIRWSLPMQTPHERDD